MSDSREAASTKNEEPAADDVGVPEAEPRTAACGLLQLKLPQSGLLKLPRSGTLNNEDIFL